MEGGTDDLWPERGRLKGQVRVLPPLFRPLGRYDRAAVSLLSILIYSQDFEPLPWKPSLPLAGIEDRKGT